MAASPSENAHVSGPSGTLFKAGGPLIELTRLLARQAARKWLQHRNEPVGRSQLFGEDPCHQVASVARRLKLPGRGKSQAKGKDRVNE